ncbi:hypothetical protein NOK12_32360 [Nocardioides sp. OK12]|nr:hypothetical protein NOK12_32360 [Nocardioides sp. OK12]
MDVEVDPGLLGLGAQARRPAGVGDLGPAVALRVAEEHLHQRDPALARLPDRVGLVDVGTDRQLLGLRRHGPSLGAGTDAPARGFAGRRPGHPGAVDVSVPLPLVADERLVAATVLLLLALVLVLVGLVLLRRR